MAATVPEGADQYIREDLGYPPDIEQWSFEVEPEKAPWTYRLALFEGAEQYLGTAIYRSLAERFATVPGVTRVVQEDREWFLIRSEGLTQEELQKKLWGKFLAAAAEAFPAEKK